MGQRTGTVVPVDGRIQHRIDPSRGLKSGVGGPSMVLATGSEDRTASQRVSRLAWRIWRKCAWRKAAREMEGQYERLETWSGL